MAYNRREIQTVDISDERKIIQLKFSIPFLEMKCTGSQDTKDSVPDSDENFLRDSLSYAHQQWRKTQWAHLKNSRTSKDPNFVISSSIIEDEEVNERLKELD